MNTVSDMGVCDECDVYEELFILLLYVCVYGVCDYLDCFAD